MADQVGVEWNGPIRLGGITVLPGDIIVAEEGWIAERDFSAWAMAYVGERGSMRVISANSDLQQFVERGNLGASGLIEMMKFFLLDM